MATIIDNQVKQIRANTDTVKQIRVHAIILPLRDLWMDCEKESQLDLCLGAAWMMCKLVGGEMLVQYQSQHYTYADWAILRRTRSIVGRGRGYTC